MFHLFRVKVEDSSEVDHPSVYTFVVNITSLYRSHPLHRRHCHEPLHLLPPVTSVEGSETRDSSLGLPPPGGSGPDWSELPLTQVLTEKSSQLGRTVPFDPVAGSQKPKCTLLTTTTTTTTVLPSFPW